ncbi:flagellar hook protein FlgE [Salmonella enterica subsp. enterica]|nr:flagellar hook protein FlgE [Salmonella enterica subsp. enterica]
MSFSQAVSGLNAAATNLDVIGNNIANSATYGFKSGTASFADMFAGSKVGLGVKVAGITQDFTDGTTTNTGRGLDVAISQNGFFRLVDSNGSVFYSRNGQFKLDENRNLVNMQGMQLTGYPATGTPPTIQQGRILRDHHSEHADGGEIDHHRVNADQPELNGPCTV